MPQDDLDVLLNPLAYLDEIEDGSEEDQLSSQFQLNTPQAGDDRYQQALTSHESCRRLIIRRSKYQVSSCHLSSVTTKWSPASF